MVDAESRRLSAEHAVREADACEAEGNAERSLEALRRAVLLYAAADALRDNPEEAGPQTAARADACRRFAAALATAERHAEAANIYQEATDLYGLLDDDASRRRAAECARSLLASVAAVKSQPRERLHLLVAHYERMQEQIALDADSEARQADCRMHVARIYQRRDRPADAIAAYDAALALLDACEVTAEVGLAKAECHHRAATLLAQADGGAEAAAHRYRTAIALYAVHEPFIYGHQQSLEMCRAALARIDAALAKEHAVRNPSRE
ncbi:MAG TPA: hypothetical protein VKT77_01570 [Chthonomonadaceae bacterium]|nr:hypothetical protein [Chthonomonadaceae bacterium]